MKIFDCTTFFDEKMMMDIRFNVLNKFVYKFIVVESLFSHSGQKKKSILKKLITQILKTKLSTL